MLFDKKTELEFSSCEKQLSDIDQKSQEIENNNLEGSHYQRNNISHKIREAVNPRKIKI